MDNHNFRNIGPNFCKLSPKVIQLKPNFSKRDHDIDYCSLPYFCHPDEFDDFLDIAPKDKNYEGDLDCTPPPKSSRKGSTPPTPLPCVRP